MPYTVWGQAKGGGLPMVHQLVVIEMFAALARYVVIAVIT